MIRTKGTHRRPREWNVPLLALGPTLKWPWRVFSVAMMGLLGGFLLAPGAALAKTEASLNVVVLGDPFSFGYATSANAALREAAPPTLAALNQIQTANPGVQLNVVFIPLKDASTSALNHPAGTGAFTGQSPLIKSVSQASIVIVGLGAGNASLAAPMRSVLFSPSASQTAFTQLMTAFDNGSYLRSQSALLAQVAADTAPGTAIITLGYPNVKAQQHGSSLALWSPYSWTTISQQQANMSDQLVSALNTSNQLATSIASVQHPALRFVFANLSAAAQAAGSASSQHRSSKAKGQASSSPSQSASPTLIGGALLPVFDQAVNNELATKGVLGAQKVSAVTSKSPWNLTVLVPLASQSQQQAQSQQQGQSQQQAQPQQGWSNSGVNAPSPPKPPAFQPPASLPAGPPSVPLLPQNGGSGNNGQSAPSQGSSQGSTGHHHAGSPSGQPGSTGQPQPAPTTTPAAGTGQQKPASQPAPSKSPSAASGQQTGALSNQLGSAGQTEPSQPSTAAQPNGSSQPAPTQPAPTTPAPQRPGTPSSGNLPVLPTPPAPIPEPIAPAQSPGVGGLAPGTGTSPSDSAAPQAPTTLPMIPAPGAPTTTGAAPATPSAPAATTAPASPSAFGTTTPATTSANGATVPATTTSANGATVPATTTSANGATVPVTTPAARTTVPTTAPATGTPATTSASGATAPATTSASATTTPASASGAATTTPASASGAGTTATGSASGAATASGGSGSGGATA